MSNPAFSRHELINQLPGDVKTDIFEAENQRQANVAQTEGSDHSFGCFLKEVDSRFFNWLTTEWTLWWK